MTSGKLDTTIIAYCKDTYDREASAIVAVNPKSSFICVLSNKKFLSIS